VVAPRPDVENKIIFSGFFTPKISYFFVASPDVVENQSIFIVLLLSLLYEMIINFNMFSSSVEDRINRQIDSVVLATT
jgi:hypothetical protein